MFRWFICLILLFSLTGLVFYVGSVSAAVSGSMCKALNDGRMVFYVVNLTEAKAVDDYLAKQGNKFVIVEIVIKNLKGEPLSFSAFFAKLRDNEGYEYTYDLMATSALDFSFSGGKIASKDTVRGQLAFQIPENITELTLYYCDLISEFIVNLTPSPEPDLIPESEYTPKTGVGDTVQNGRVALTLNSYEEKYWISIYHAKEGWKYLIVDVTIKNIGSEKVSYNPLYFNVKDSMRHQFNPDSATSALTGGLTSGELTPGESIKGKIAFQVPENETYFTLQYDDMLSFFAEPAIPEFPSNITLPILITALTITLLTEKIKQKLKVRTHIK